MEKEFCFFFFKQKTAYEIGTGDWSSDVCSSDLRAGSMNFWRCERVLTSKIAPGTLIHRSSRLFLFQDRKSVV